MELLNQIKSENSVCSNVDLLKILNYSSQDLLNDDLSCSTKKNFKTTIDNKKFENEKKSLIENLNEYDILIKGLENNLDSNKSNDYHSQDLIFKCQSLFEFIVKIDNFIDNKYDFPNNLLTKTKVYYKLRNENIILYDKYIDTLKNLSTIV